jgi:Lanthionine synthetase C-like protein
VLYVADVFEPLTETPWDPTRVSALVREVVADAEDAFAEDALWPPHEWDAWQTPLPLQGLYIGAAGVIWALATLRDRGHAESRLDLARAARLTLEAWRREPSLMRIDLPDPAEASLLEGETGILAVLLRLEHDAQLAGRLLELVRANACNPADEVMWGAPGTMLAAASMLEITGEDRWADAWCGSATALLARRDADGLWTQHLHGEESRDLGPIHGAVGNVLVLLQGEQLLPAEERRRLTDESAALLRRAAVVEDGLANWPASEGRELLAGDGQIRVQWDVGAPGIVASAASYLDEDLLLAGAELTWRAGPHGDDKGAGLCHGTAGNGYALLKAFARTQDERWLERARRFAVHALEQAARAREQRGRGRYSLWTGDVGAALFASDCLEGRARFPILETWT